MSDDQSHQATSGLGHNAPASTTMFANVSLLIGVSSGEGPDVLFVPPSALGSAGYQLSRAIYAVVKNLFSRNRETISDVLLHQVSDSLQWASANLSGHSIKLKVPTD